MLLLWYCAAHVLAAAFNFSFTSVQSRPGSSKTQCKQCPPRLPLSWFLLNYVCAQNEICSPSALGYLWPNRGARESNQAQPSLGPL